LPSSNQNRKFKRQYNWGQPCGHQVRESIKDGKDENTKKKTDIKLTILLKTILTNEPVIALVDTGSDVSLIKQKCLKPNTIVNPNSNISFSGISHQSILPLGTVKDTLIINNNLFEHELLIIDNHLNLPYDAIIGMDFLNKFTKISIDITNLNLTLTDKDKTFTIKINDKVAPIKKQKSYVTYNVNKNRKKIQRTNLKKTNNNKKNNYDDTEWKDEPLEINMNNSNTVTNNIKINPSQEDYYLEIRHIPGKNNIAADTFNSLPPNMETDTEKKKALVATRNQQKKLDEIVDKNQADISKSQTPDQPVPSKIEEKSYNNFLHSFQAKNLYNKNVIINNSHISKEEIEVFITDSKLEVLSEKHKLLLQEQEDLTGIVEIENKKGQIKTVIFISEINMARLTCQDFFNLMSNLKNYLIKNNINTITLINNFSNNDTRIFYRIIEYVFLFENIKITLCSEKIEVTDDSEKQSILVECHDSPNGGHMGIDKTFEKIQQKYTWTGLHKDVLNFVTKCEICQLSKVGGRKNKCKMKITSMSKHPFDILSLDCVGPLTPTLEHGYKYILTVQCDLTKYVIAIPLVNMEASSISKAFVEQIVLRYGIPNHIRTDLGSDFTSKLFTNMCKLLKIDKRTTAPFSTSSNVELERIGREIGNQLRCYFSRDPQGWASYLQYILFSYNNTKNSTTNFAPFELLYGHEAILPLTFHKKPEIVYNCDDYLLELKDKFRKVHEIARKKILDKKIEQKTT
jgi:Integrase zinc binding domain/Retroviral aspartyl protease